MNNIHINRTHKLDSIYILISNDGQGREKRGTCFSISEKIVITAWHVIESIVNYSCYLTSDDADAENALSLHLIDKDEDLDVAILEVVEHAFSSYIQVNDMYCLKGRPVSSCGYPKEKGRKHCTIDTEITENYDNIKSDNISFEIKQSTNITNYKGMSGSPLLVNGQSIGILLIQQGGASLYCISFRDICEKNSVISEYLNLNRKKNNPQEVLFYRYSLKSEQFYLERNEDINFTKSILLNNVWLSGASGSGKTALLMRNLIMHEIQYCYVDFSAITVLNKSDVLDEIFYSICEKFDLDEFERKGNIIKDICNLIKHLNIKKLTIVIDELSIESSELLREVANSLMQLVNHVANKYEENTLKFSVSTIVSPSDLLSNLSKAKEFFYFLNCDSWDTELENLFYILCINLCLNIENEKYLVLEKSRNSPRLLKSIIKEIIILDNVNLETVNNAICKVLGEVVAHD